MVAYSVTQVRTHLSAILRLVDHGEAVVITRRGQAVARITPERRSTSEMPAIDWATVDAFRESLKKTRSSVRGMRDRNRY